MSNQLPEIRTDEDKIIETLIIEGNDSLYEDLVRCRNKNLSVHSYILTTQNFCVQINCLSSKCLFSSYIEFTYDNTNRTSYQQGKVFIMSKMSFLIMTTKSRKILSKILST